MIHELKCLPEYFEALAAGKKTFDIRKNDRGFQVGDLIALNEYLPDGDLYDITKSEEPFSRRTENGSYSGRHQLYQITYVLDNAKLLPAGYVAMSLNRVI